MQFGAFLLGALMVVSALADMMNTLVSTHTGNQNWWLSRRIARASWGIIRLVAARLPEGRWRESVLGLYPPILVMLFLIAWIAQQIVGFGLLWWSLGDVSGAETFADHLYYSGILFFTVGFGEIVPSASVPRLGAVIEAFAGVITIALVIGYLPALYGAYSERERKLMTLDAGTDKRIDPTDLIVAWSPNADVDQLLSHFKEWEDWIAGVLETHTTFPMLMLFRSHHEGQSWITALGLVTDAALQAEVIVGAEGRSAYWTLRRATHLLQTLTKGVDLSEYRARLDKAYASPDSPQFYVDLRARLEGHGFEVRPLAEMRATTLAARRGYDAQMEYLIDQLVAPRGFWSHEIAVERLPESLVKN